MTELKKVNVIELIILQDAKGNDIARLEDIKNGISLEEIKNLFLTYQNWNQVYLAMLHSDDLGTNCLYLRKTDRKWTYNIICIGLDGRAVYEYLDKDHFSNTLAVLNNLVTNLDPLALEWLDEEFITGGTVEYYKDPAYFFVDITDAGISDFYDLDKKTFMLSDKMSAIIGVVKKSFNQNELIKIIKQHKKNIIAFFGKAKGIGVIKSEGQYKSHIYPRYFVRQELQKLGFTLNRGYSEEIYEKWIKHE